MGTQTTVPCTQAEDSSLFRPPQSPNWVEVCQVSTVFFFPVSIEWWVCLGLFVLSLQVTGFVSVEPDCWFLQVCLLFRFQSVSHEQAPTEGILETRLSVWQGRSVGPGSYGLDQLSWGLVGLTRSQWRWWYFNLFPHSVTGAVQLCKWPLF